METEVLDAHPVAGMSVRAAELAGLWHRRPRLSGEALALALLSAATVADRAERTRPTVVASGPSARLGPGAGPARMTAAALAEVVRAARGRLLVVGYAHHPSSGAAAELGTAAGRGVAVDLVLEERTGALEAFRRYVEGRPGIRLWRWPEERRGANGRASLHAKVVAADRRLALVGSANLTGYALRHNIEAGVLVRSPEQVSGLVGHFDALMGPEGPLERV